jgi:hypothetical protein
MLQRIQSLFLLLAIVSSALLFTFDLFTATNVVQEGSDLNEEVVMNAYQINYSMTTANDAKSEAKNNMVPLIINSLVILMTLICIFQFKKRQFQSTVTRFLILLETALIVFIILSFDNATGMLQSEDFEKTYGIGLILLVLNLIFFYLANRRIMHDMKLVSSTDRLR